MSKRGQSMPLRKTFTTHLLIIIALMLGLAVTSACTNKPGPGQQVALEVGERKVTVNQLKKDISLLSSDLLKPNTESIRLEGPLLDSIVDYYIIVQYAQQQEISVSQPELLRAIEKIKKDYPEESFKETLLRRYVGMEQWKDALKRQLLRKKVFDSVTLDIRPPSYMEIERYYRDHIHEFTRPARVRFRQIVTRTKDKAREALERIKKGESIADLARSFSYSAEATKGGEVGWVEKGQLVPSMDKVLFSLPVGKVSPIVKSPYGYHIFQVIEKDPGGLQPLKKVAATIQAQLYGQAKERAFAKWLEQQRSKITVRVLVKSLERK